MQLYFGIRGCESWIPLKAAYDEVYRDAARGSFSSTDIHVDENEDDLKTDFTARFTPEFSSQILPRYAKVLGNTFY